MLKMTRYIYIILNLQVGSSKLAKINYRLQEISGGADSQKFMGGISVIASGDNATLSTEIEM